MSRRSPRWTLHAAGAPRAARVAPRGAAVATCAACAALLLGASPGPSRLQAAPPAASEGRAGPVAAIAAWTETDAAAPTGGSATCCGPVPSAASPALRPASALTAAPEPYRLAAPTALPESYRLAAVWQPQVPTGAMLFHPAGIAAGAGGLVVAEAGNGRLTWASADGESPTALFPGEPAVRIGRAGSQPGELSAPEDVAVSTDGRRFYVADAGNRRVQVFGTDGAVQAVWTGLGVPRGIAVARAPAVPGEPAAGDRVYVSDAENGVVRVLAADGTPWAVWSLPPPGAMPSRPLGLSIAPDGRLVVADEANQRIVWLDAEGTAGTAGAVVGTLALDNATGPGGAPTDVGVDAGGDVYVAVARGVLRFRRASPPPGAGPGRGVAADLEHVATWPPLTERLLVRGSGTGCGGPPPWTEVVAESGSHEGVQRLDLKPGVGLFVTYAPSMRWPDRVVVYPATRSGISPPESGYGSVWPRLCRDYAPSGGGHAGDFDRIDAGRDPSYGVSHDAAGQARAWRSDGRRHDISPTPPRGPAVDVAVDLARPDAVALLDGNQVRVGDVRIRVLDPGQIVRRDRTMECRRSLPIPGRAEGLCIPDDRWWLPALTFQTLSSGVQVVGAVDAGGGRVLLRTTGGQLAGQIPLRGAGTGFRSYVDVDFDARGQLWVLAHDGAVRVFDDRGRARGEMALSGPAAGRAESLAVAADGTFFVLTGDGRIVKYRPHAAPTPSPTVTPSSPPGPTSRPTRTPPRPTATLAPTQPREALPVAEWRPAELAGPGRYRDLAVGPDGRVLVPDGDHDRIVVFEPGPARPTPAAPTPEPDACRFEPSKAADPTRLPLGGTTEVTLRLQGTCGSRHAAVDAAVVVDVSCQMAGERFARAKDGLAALIDAMVLPGDRLAIVTFDERQGGARIVVPLTADRQALRDAVKDLTTDCRMIGLCGELDFWRLGYVRSYLYPHGCLTEGRISDGLRGGREVLFGPSARPDAGKVLAMLSSSLHDAQHVVATLSLDPGMFEPPLSEGELAAWRQVLPPEVIAPVTDREHARWEAWKLREAAVRVFTTGVGVDSYGAGHPPDEGLLAALAWPASGYRPAGTPAELVGVLESEGREISSRVLIATVTITDRIPSNMRLVPGSVLPPAEILPEAGRSDAVIRWTFHDVALAGLPDLRYRLQPLDAGTWPTNVEAYADLVDGLGAAGRLAFGVPRVEVIGPTATDEPTSTSVARTATASVTGLPSSTPLATPSASATASPAPTRRSTATDGPPAPLYLPFAFVWHCKPSPIPLDVVLAIDTSSSMTGDKLDAARRAAGVFLGFVDLRTGRDRAAVESFDAGSRLDQALTHDRAALVAALGRLTTTPGTRIDLGLGAAVDALIGPLARADADRAVLLLTDGLPMPGTEDAVLAEAGRARGVTRSVWAVGLGADVDPAFLERLAGDPARVLLAPVPADLERTYRLAASGIVCR